MCLKTSGLFQIDRLCPNLVIWIKTIFGTPSSQLIIQKHSTETALLYVFNDLTALDSGSISILTLLDLSTAFDAIDHILLTHLKNAFGICDLALLFFDSYLQGRTLIIIVNEVKSSPSLLTCGVPQGSVLGPILFILYTWPLSDVISHHSVSHHMFADDLNCTNLNSPSEAFDACFP